MLFHDIFRNRYTVRDQGGERLGDEASESEQKGVMQSTGTDFAKQTLAFSENGGKFGNFG